MPKLANKSLVPELRHLLAECKIYGIGEFGQMGIINSIAQVVDDREIVEVLRETIPLMQTMENEYLRNTIYETLYRLSRRIGVRMSADGQI